jgi:type VI secretion system protein ImpJ
MTENNRIIWSEGLFLRPQHFQQQERFLESYVEGRAAAVRVPFWGFTELDIERDLLAIGRLGIRRARGIFPDGTPFNMPDNEPLPAPLEIGTQLRNQVVHLAVPLRKSGLMLAGADDPDLAIARYRGRDYEARDVISTSNEPADLQVAALNARLLPESEPAADFARIALAHVVECRADGHVILDDAFIPTVLRCGAAPRLATFLSELQGLLHQRGDALAARTVATGRGGAAEIADFLLLQTINRHEPVVIHLAASGDCHPEELYRLLLQMAGDLSTLTSATRRPAQFPGYRHNALRVSFEPVIQDLRTLLSVVLERNAISLPLEQKKFGISLATVSDRTLFDNAVFVLAARADLGAEELRNRFPMQLKVGSVDQIRDLVNLQLSGVGVQAMAVAPRQIPYHAGCVYFELDRSGELWKGLKTSGVIALHQAGDLPGLVMELWAIRS